MVQRQTTRSAHADDGMSLVEVLIAAVVLALLSTAVLGVVVRAQAANADTRSRTAAASLAQREIEYLREEFTRSAAAPLTIANAGVVTNPHPLPGGTAGQPLLLDNVPYTVTRAVQWNVTGAGASACEGGSLVSHPTLGVTVTVTWPDMGSTLPVVSHIQLAPPKGTGTSTTQAFVAVKVVDSRGAAHPGRAVRVTSASGASTSALTDAAGCAVATATPPAAGTTYTATMIDSGYVDIAGVANPTKVTGVLRPGQLNASLSFAYDRAATLRLRIVDSGGTPLPDAQAAGAELTLVATESSGASASSSRTAAGTLTTITGLWPSRYGAYYGATPPGGGYGSVQLAPGAVGDLDVILELAAGEVIDLPPGADRVIAVRGAGACTDPSARTVDPAGFTLIPGTWSFYAAGLSFDCSPGPASVALVSGPNGAVPFQPSTLRAIGVPPGGVLWAVSTSRATGLTTCPDPATAATAQNVDGARTGGVAMAAGDWFVYRTAGTADGECLSVPRGAYPQNVAYGAVTPLVWVDQLPPARLTVSAVPTGDQWRVILSRTPVPTGCTAALPSGATQLGTANSTSVTGTVEQGTWFVYRQRTNLTSNTNRCRPMAGTGQVTMLGGPTVWSADFSTGAVTSS